MQYDDAFTLQRVDEEEVANFNFMAGMVPFIQQLLADVSCAYMIQVSESHR